MSIGPVLTFSLLMISNDKALAGLRINVGALFLIFGEYKVFGRQFTSGGGFQYWINRFLEDGAYPFMVPVLRNFVLSHAKSISFLVAYGELAIGLTLAFGVLVRPASVCGLIYMLTLLLDVDYHDLRERDYQLLAPAALAERLRKVAELFPANPGFEFAIYYKRRS